MAKKVLKANIFSTSSIQELQKQLREYQDSLNKKCEIFTEELAKRGVEIAKARVTTLDAIFTGDLLNNIHEKKGNGDKNSVIFFITADSRHAAFVEFGTGQLGLEGSYPYPFPEGVEWNYNTGKTIFEIAPGKYGWFYPKDGKWYFTQGMPSRPFMYETSLELMQEIPQIAKMVFGGR
mgnify:FL=1